MFSLHSKGWGVSGHAGIFLPSSHEQLSQSREEEVLYLVLVPPLRAEAVIKCRPAFSMLWEHSPNSMPLKPRLQFRVWLCGALPTK